jgi:hypothetical protein
LDWEYDAAMILSNDGYMYSEAQSRLSASGGPEDFARKERFDYFAPPESIQHANPSPSSYYGRTTLLVVATALYVLGGKKVTDSVRFTLGQNRAL